MACEAPSPVVTTLFLAPDSAADLSSEPVIFADVPPLIRPGRYQAVGDRGRLVPMFGVRKLVVPWSVQVESDDEDNREVKLSRFYNVQAAPVGRAFRVGGHSMYAREWTLITGRRPQRRDRLSPSAFKGVLAVVEVRTVEIDSRQKPLPLEARYSIVARILELKAGGGPRP